MNGNKSFTWGFWIVWVLATLIGVFAAFWVCYFAILIVGFNIPSLPNNVYLLAASLVLAATYGVVIGLAQRSVLLRRAPGVKSWGWASMAGMFIAGPLTVQNNAWFAPYAPLTNTLAAMAGLGLALGVTQWLVLRGEVLGSAIWIGLSLLGWLAGGWLGYLVWFSNLRWVAILYSVAQYSVGTAFTAAALALWLKPAAAPEPAEA